MKNIIVSKNEWLQARKAFLKKEKDFTKLRDELSKERRALPWIAVETNYTFQGPEGEVSLSDLFEDRSQLILYHFMLHPTWDEGCSGCSLMVDNLPASMAHLEQKDLKYVVVSQAPMEKILPFKARMGWTFKWVSSFGNRFNYDFNVSFTPEETEKKKVNYNYGISEHPWQEGPGFSIFYKDTDGKIYHTYSTFARGLDMLISTYHLLDLTPKGRDETGPMSWVKHHDKY